MENISFCNWLYCNKCCTTYKQDLRFQLSECGHIFCDKCVPQLDKSMNSCLVCRRSTSYIEINNNMDPSIQKFFMPFEKQMKETLDIYKFQMQHKDKLLEILRQKYDNLKKCWSQNMAANMKLKNENKMLRTITKRYYNNCRPSMLDSFTTTPSIDSEQDTRVSNISMQSMQYFTKPVPGYAQKVVNKPGNVSRDVITPIHHMGGRFGDQITPLQQQFSQMPINTSASLEKLRHSKFIVKKN